MSRVTFIDDLAAWLASHGAGTVGTSIFLGQLPQDKPESILLVETGGRQSDRAIGVDRPSVQVTARSASYATAKTKAHQVYDLLSECPSFQQGTSRVTYAKALQQPTSLGQDEINLWRIVCNYSIWLAR